MKEGSRIKTKPDSHGVKMRPAKTLKIKPEADHITAPMAPS